MGNATYKLLGDEPDLPFDIEKKGLQYRAHSKSKEEFTGWERVKYLFKLDMYGDISPELQRCKDMVFVTLLAGAIMGGVGRSRIAYVNFFRSNAHTAFETPLQARSKLQETVILGFGSGAFRIGWRVSVFSSVYSLSSTCLTAYRGKASILDPVVGGTLAGFVYKFHEGPRLTLAGAVIGGLFGLVGGSITSLATKMTGLTPDEILAYDHKNILDKRRKEYEDMRSVRPENPIHTFTPADLLAELTKEESTASQSADKPSTQETPVTAQAESIVALTQAA